MRIISFLTSLVATIFIVYLLSMSIKIDSKTSLPPLGKFFCPFSGFWQNAIADNGQGDLKIKLPNCKSNVKIKIDDRMVPHIYAQNDHDLVYAQGYITAMNRLWQMDISTRAASGRLSEVLGSRTLNYDRTSRRKGLAFAAENAINEWKKDPKLFQMVEAYSNGINDFIHNLEPKDYPLEFKLLNYEPEDWTPLKTALFVISMAQTLAAQEFDLENSNALKIFGEEDYQLLYPDRNPKETPIITAGTKWDYLKESPPITKDSMDSQLGDLFNFPRGGSDDPHIGSNNWTVAASKTLSGFPILCNDPHLRLTLPSIWYEIQLTAPGINSYGVSLPGIPGVIIGFNEDIAWGITNTGWDVLDWYQIKWTDQSKNSYILDGKPIQVNYRVEQIMVKDSTLYLDSVKYTVWGPVVYEDKKDPKYGLAMRWLVHHVHTPDEMATFFDLNRAHNFDEYYNATQKYCAPAQNIIFASHEGDIALRILGKMPKRSTGEGKFVMDGSVSDNGWKTTYPNENNPMVKNPSTGYITSANQVTTTADFPFYYSGHFDDYRGRYINRRLHEMDSIKIEDMMKMQADPYSILAEDALPALLKNVDTTALSVAEKSIFKNLLDWDYKFRADLTAPTCFKIWWDSFQKTTWDEMYSLADSVPVLIPESWKTIELMSTNPNFKYFDIKTTPAVEHANNIALLTFKDMCIEFGKFSSAPQNKGGKWAKFKNTTIEHLGKIPAFGRKDIAVDGFKDAINATTEFNGPSWRMVVELSNPIKAYGIYPGGQSGNPASRYYDNMIDKWVNGQLDELLFLKEEGEESDKIKYSIELTSK